jgi:hypothetical protein
MKKILLASLLLVQGVAHADTCSTKLMPTFTSAQAQSLCRNFGSSVSTSLIPSANNTYDIGSSSLRWKDLYLSGVISYSNSAMTIVANTADAADTAQISIGGGGAATGARGGFLILEGNEESGAGRTTLGSGDGVINFDVSTGTRWRIDTSGNLISAATNGGDLNFTATGRTVAIQEATAGAACMGTLTANGATPVVTSTTCATTGSRIFLTRTSAETGTTDAWISALTNGVSFAITSEAADTGTYNWVIFHEAS